MEKPRPAAISARVGGRPADSRWLRIQSRIWRWRAVNAGAAGDASEGAAERGKKVGISSYRMYMRYRNYKQYEAAVKLRRNCGDGGERAYRSLHRPAPREFVTWPSCHAGPSDDNDCICVSDNGGPALVIVPCAAASDETAMAAASVEKDAKRLRAFMGAAALPAQPSRRGPATPRMLR